jgi:DnaJ-class molecular chaperone
MNKLFLFSTAVAVMMLSSYTTFGYTQEAIGGGEKGYYVAQAQQVKMKKCKDCKGKGTVTQTDKCSTCGGDGRLSTKEAIN